ncbi:vacuolar ATP synthase subunit G1, putative [Cryptosporidium muris RN66]|uniref:Vacuolar ATP synthase subunit G1, putative n=1 Tax=Cryptosporidium muris (strain RN66) TaxID=441375 RepID=B6AE85_CRYMR|nr:vacuolar ATP synthase subunit G1, putative [Cryptosporidium muris RN66]EEA06526.1 vacuolar ATP synthase subunit G1, putative [Cryptosporidium muris RN66]|eukprot:XP_002140875.1 vacuolar ATP synthase subunit G1 [Cryptosporidium muris RN66]
MASTAKSPANSSVLIQQLVKAEADAEEVVRRAKENRIRKLKEAQISAEEELIAFREKEEAQFNLEFNSNFSIDDDIDQSLEKSTAAAIEAVKNDFKNNGSNVAELILSKVLSVDLSIPATVIHLSSVGKLS